MKIHCLYNPQYQFLFDNYFKSSLKEDFEIITKIVDLNDYHLISIEKLRFIDEKLKENSPEEFKNQVKEDAWIIEKSNEEKRNIFTKKNKKDQND